MSIGPNKRWCFDIEDIIAQKISLHELNKINSQAVDTIRSAQGGQKIAIVPGAFKPPHRGHLAMVEEYAANNDIVKVLISNPLKRQRALSDGTVITAKKSLDMWNSLVQHLDNVQVEISNAASPVTAAFQIIDEKGPLKPGDMVTLGASSKGDDWKRWQGANNYIKKGVELLDPQSTSVEPSVHSPEYIDLLKNSSLKEDMPSVKDPTKNPRHFHASDMRYLISNAEGNEEAVELLRDFLGSHDIVNEFLAILGVSAPSEGPLEEISSAGGMGAGVGDVQGYSGKQIRKKRKNTKNENINLQIENEVYQLIIKRGIIS